MKFRFKTVFTVAAVVSIASACTKNDVPAVKPEATSVSAKIMSYGNDWQEIEGESHVTDMKGFLFQDGVIAKIFDFDTVSGNEFTFNVDSRSGNLYLVAYSGGEISVDGILESSMTEDAWTGSSVVLDDAPKHFFTGKVCLEDTRYEGKANVALKRGLARFDLRINTIDQASVKNVTLSNIARAAYVFGGDVIRTPSDPQRKDVSVSFPENLSGDANGILYVGEQVNDNIVITVTALIDGKEKTMSKEFSGDIRRNTVYTVTVLQNSIDITFDVVFDEWEDGGDTELVPVSSFIS